VHGRGRTAGLHAVRAMRRVTRAGSKPRKPGGGTPNRRPESRESLAVSRTASAPGSPSAAAAATVSSLLGVGFEDGLGTEVDTLERPPSSLDGKRSKRWFGTSRSPSGQQLATQAAQTDALYGVMREICGHLEDIKASLRSNKESANSKSAWISTDGPRTVYTRFNVLNLFEITAVSVAARFYYELRWELAEEDQVTVKGADPDRGPSDWSKEWQPQVNLDHVTGEVITVRGDNWLGVERFRGRRLAYKRWIGEARFQQKFDFRHFPFDSTEFKITLRSDLTTAEVKLVDSLDLHSERERQEWHQGKTMCGSVLDVDGFQLADFWRIDRLPIIRNVEQLGVEPGLKGERPRIQLVIRGARTSNYYVWNSICLFFVIVSMAFGTFFMDVKKLDERLDVVMASMLSAVAHKLLCAEQLPDLPYLTLLDSYVIGGVGVLCLVTIECLCARVLANKQSVADAEWLDFYAASVLLLLWVSANTYMFVLGYRHRSAGGIAEGSGTNSGWSQPLTHILYMIVGTTIFLVLLVVISSWYDGELPIPDTGSRVQLLEVYDGAANTTSTETPAS